MSFVFGVIVGIAVTVAYPKVFAWGKRVYTSIVERVNE